MKQSLNLPKPPNYYILVYSADEPWKICTWFPPESSMHRLNILSYFNQDNSCSPCRCARELVVLEEPAFNKTTVETSEFSHCEAQNEAKCGHMACMHPSWNLQTHRSTQTSSSNFSSCNLHLLTPKFWGEYRYLNTKKIVKVKKDARFQNHFSRVHSPCQISSVYRCTPSVLSTKLFISECESRDTIQHCSWSSPSAVAKLSTRFGAVSMFLLSTSMRMYKEHCLGKRKP